MGLIRELAQQARGLLRRPATPLLLMLTIGLGLAGVLTVLAVADALFGKPLPYRDDERLALVFSTVPDEGRAYQSTSTPNYLDWRAAARTVDLEAVSTARTFLLSDPEHPRNVEGEYVSSGYLPLLGVPVARGRHLEPDDDRVGAPPVVVISDRLWREQFGAAPDVVGRRIRLADRSFEIVGVLGPAYRGILWDPVDVWVPLALAREILGERYATDRSLGWHLVVARLREGATLEQARRELDDLAVRLERQYPRENQGKRTSIEDLRSFYFGDELRRGLAYLTAAALFVVILISVNASSLALGWVAERRQELATRRAFGAGRRHLIWTLAASLGPPLAAGLALAFALAWWLAPRLIGLSDIPPATLTLSWIDERSALAGLGLAALLAAVVTAISYRSLTGGTIESALRSGGRSSAARLRSLRRFVLVETVLAVVLLVGAGLLLRSLAVLGAREPGLEVEGRTVLQLDLQPSRYQDPSARVRFAQRLLAGVAAQPGVESAAIDAPRLPPRANLSATLLPEGAGDERDSLQVYRHSITAELPTTLGVALLEGRSFSSGDDEDSAPVALVSRTVADRLGAGSAIGRRFQLRPDLAGDRRWTVVGVLADIAGRDLAPGEGGEPDVYLPFAQAPESALFLVVKTAPAAAGTADLARTLHHEVRQLDRDLALAPVETMASRYALLTADQRFHASVAGAFSALALVLASLGLFGVLDLSVRARRRELGIRLAFGAHPRQLVGMVLREALLLSALGLAVGLALALLLRRALQSLLVGVAAHDPLTLFAVSAIVLLTAATAALVPALRARRVDAAAELVRPT